MFRDLAACPGYFMLDGCSSRKDLFFNFCLWTQKAKAPPCYF